ncbi:hypothetical protein [Cryobacterium sp. Hz7]|uniref:hypothetical protein n=1 Tax=Cryobacterium sp. Hz7 TaxID=1259166 RepID=UPI001F546ABC|nr:hypothetical protein [Cryobacterium sp. Hz7]
MTGMSVVRACRLLGHSRASFYRHRRPAVDTRVPMPQADRCQPAALSQSERASVLEILNLTPYAGLSVCQAFYRSWDDCYYVASKSSRYRIARAAGQVGDRRRQATGSPKKIPELVANGPSQVWSWDITKVRGPAAANGSTSTSSSIFGPAGQWAGGSRTTKTATSPKT